MANTTQFKETSGLPRGFVAACALAFIASALATAHFCRSMCCQMDMPGGWSMSMMWMRMPGQSWFAFAASFLLMWTAMMVAMMLPSALPAFLRTKRAAISLCVIATGYFAVWAAFGVIMYALGVELATATMQWENLSRAVPMLSAVVLIAAGAFQFTRWKVNSLLRCRSSFGCACVCPERQRDFQLGCRQGAACCLCCAGPMTVLIVLGLMNPAVMIAIAVVIAAEKLMPKPELIARISGAAAVITGLLLLARIFF